LPLIEVMPEKDGPTNRILLGHLISNGDCLYATAVARQIKRDFPGCHLTWAVSSLCRKIIEENPYVDEIWEIPLAKWSFELLQPCWSSFAEEALKRYDQGLYDFVFFTQIYPGNPHHFEGTVRPGIFLGYPGKITVPIQPLLFLRQEEVERVDRFAEVNRLGSFEEVILFESSGKSGQTHITPEFALEAAERIAQDFGGRHAVILSSHHAVPRLQKGVIDGSVLTLREMAELTKHCTLLIGCSSGISCVATSSWAKPLPMIQMLTNRCAMFASLAHDYLYFGLPTSHVIEMFDADVGRLVSCFAAYLQDGWPRARALYHEEPQIAFTYYLHFAETILLAVYDYYGFCVSLRHTVNRYGWNRELESALNEVAYKILSKTAVARAGSPDELLCRLCGPARALSSASIGVSGYDAPSIRQETCVLSLRRGKTELEEILRAAGGFVEGDLELAQLVEALLDNAPRERMDSFKKPERNANGIARILALVQEAEYSFAWRELIEWKETAPGWNSELEEVLGDLNWMEGHHMEALDCYQNTLSNRPNCSKLQQKIDRLLIRNDPKPATEQPEPNLGDLGIVFYMPGPVNNFSMKALASVRLKITHRANLRTAFLTIPGKDAKAWSLIDGEDLLNGEHGFVFQTPKRAPDSKEFVSAAIDWAACKGKKWVALTRLDTVVTPGFLRMLQGQLALQPNGLVVERQEFPKQQPFTPGLILIATDWWKRNRHWFRGYRLHGFDWMALYAIKILRRAKADYVCDAEQQLLTIEAETPLIDHKERLRLLIPFLQGDLGDMIRWGLFALSCNSGNQDSSKIATKTLVQHFFRSGILKTFFFCAASLLRLGKAAVPQTMRRVRRF
jgi:hypothetical protein